MATQENVVVEDSTESFINDKTKKNLEIETSNYNFASPNNPLYDLIERQAKEFEEFGKRMSLDLQNFYKEYLNRQKGMNKVKNGYNEIEKVCKEFEEKIILQSQLIESLKARIEELETDSIVKDQDIKILRNEFNESVKTLSEQDNEKYQRRDSLTDQFSEILNMESFNDSINEINGDGAIFLHETIETRSGSIILRCKECGKNFRNHVRFMYHAKEKHQYKWLCLVCYQVFLSGRDRGIHMRKNHKKDYSCTLCTKACYDITGLREHFRAKHPGSTFPPTQPSIPSQPSILSRSSFPLRLQPFVPLTSVPSQSSIPSQPSQSSIPLTTPQTTFGKFIHEIIPYKFPTKHVPPFQLKCKICGALFNTYTTFIKHAKSKHGYKLLCIYCCQLFHQKAPRNKHMKEDHIHKCQTCDKEFRNGDGLISHCKAKKHNVEEAIHSVYSKLREYHSAQEENLQDLNIENIIESANGNNVKENQIQEENELDNMKNGTEKDSDDDSDLYSFDDDDDIDDEKSADNGDDADDGVNFPKCEECQLYFRDNKQLENHNKYHYQNIF
ncbi:unnamed protein product [Rhizophagus irregularis]|nr:unnamed protein product [Rhizophagus irregularis]